MTLTVPGFSCLSPKNGLEAHDWMSRKASVLHGEITNRVLEGLRRPGFSVYRCKRCGYATAFPIRKGPKRESRRAKRGD